jgi:hypothetical protein
MAHSCKGSKSHHHFLSFCLLYFSRFLLWFVKFVPSGDVVTVKSKPVALLCDPFFCDSCEWIHSFYPRIFWAQFSLLIKGSGCGVCGISFPVSLHTHEKLLYLCQVSGWTNSDRFPTGALLLRQHWFSVPHHRPSQSKAPCGAIYTHLCSVVFYNARNFTRATQHGI